MTSLGANLDVLVKIVDEGTGEDDEALGWLARLLVVRSCGYLEQTAFEVCRSYVGRRAGGPVRSFALSWLERTRNPTPDALRELVGRFDARYAEELWDLLNGDDERLYRELSFLVDRRNRIAHGLSEGIGSRKAIQLKNVAVELADWFVLRFNPK